jgi:BON domain-containing protein
VAVKKEIKEWWTKALLGEQLSAHPVMGCRINVAVDGSAIRLTGEVETAEEAQQIVREAQSLGMVETVVNDLTIVPDSQPYHFQTVIAVFPDEERAQVACNAAPSWRLRGQEEDHARTLASRDEARNWLQRRAAAAGVPEDRISRYIHAIERGKTLFADRVPEADALRLISRLGGWSAFVIMALADSALIYSLITGSSA